MRLQGILHISTVQCIKRTGYEENRYKKSSPMARQRRTTRDNFLLFQKALLLMFGNGTTEGATAPLRFSLCGTVCHNHRCFPQRRNVTLPHFKSNRQIALQKDLHPVVAGHVAMISPPATDCDYSTGISSVRWEIPNSSMSLLLFRNNVHSGLGFLNHPLDDSLRLGF